MEYFEKTQPKYWIVFAFSWGAVDIKTWNTINKIWIKNYGKNCFIPYHASRVALRKKVRNDNSKGIKTLVGFTFEESD
jgi:hypothetical protein